MIKPEEIILKIKTLEQKLLQELQQKQDEYSYITEGRQLRRDFEDLNRCD